MNLKQFAKDVKEEFTLGGFLTVLGAFFFSLSIVGLHGVVTNQFTLPLSEAFDVAKSVIAVKDSWDKAAGIITAAMMGTIYKKLGPRWLAIAGGASVAIGYVLIANSTGLIGIYIASFFTGLGKAAAGGLMFFTIVKPWWNKAFGTFAALCGTASGLGGVLFTTTVTNSIVNKGYQAGAYKVAILTVIFSVIGGLLMRESPNDALRNQAKAEKEARARGEKVQVKLEKLTKGGSKAPTGAHALTYEDFLKTPITWMMMIMICLASFNVATSLFSPVAAANGYAEPTVVGGLALTMYSALLIWTKIGSGVLRDAFGMNVVIPIMYIPALICLGLNLFTNVSEGAYPYIWALMAFSGTATQLLVGFVGVQSFGKYYNVTVQGLTTTAFNIFGVFAGPIRLLPYDLTGSYNTTFVVMIISAILQVVLAYTCMGMGKKLIAKYDEKFAAEDAAAAA